MPNPNTILLVDDDPDCRSLVRDAAAEAGVAAVLREATSGTEAMEILRRRGRHAGAPRPALVLLDVELPGMGGQEVLRRIKADPVLRRMSVVMLTSLDDDRQRQRALHAGAAEYIVKPIAPSTLARLVNQLMPPGSLRPHAVHTTD